MKNDHIKNGRIKSDRIKSGRIKSDRIKTDHIKRITDPSGMTFYYRGKFTFLKSTLNFYSFPNTYLDFTKRK
jgi:hypothetical protein